MIDVKRYDPVIKREVDFNTEYAGMEEYTNGEFVLYSDYEKLFNKIKILKDVLNNSSKTLEKCDNNKNEKLDFFKDIYNGKKLYIKYFDFEYDSDLDWSYTYSNNATGL